MVPTSAFITPENFLRGPRYDFIADVLQEDASGWDGNPPTLLFKDYPGLIEEEVQKTLPESTITPAAQSQPEPEQATDVDTVSSSPPTSPHEMSEAELDEQFLNTSVADRLRQIIDSYRDSPSMANVIPDQTTDSTATSEAEPVRQSHSDVSGKNSESKVLGWALDPAANNEASESDSLPVFIPIMEGFPDSSVWTPAPPEVPHIDISSKRDFGIDSSAQSAAFEQRMEMDHSRTHWEDPLKGSIFRHGSSIAAREPDLTVKAVPSEYVIEASPTKLSMETAGPDSGNSADSSDTTSSSSEKIYATLEDRICTTGDNIPSFCKGPCIPVDRYADVQAGILVPLHQATDETCGVFWNQVWGVLSTLR